MSDGKECGTHTATVSYGNTITLGGTLSSGTATFTFSSHDNDVESYSSWCDVGRGGGQNLSQNLLLLLLQTQYKLAYCICWCLIEIEVKNKALLAGAAG